MKNLFLVFALTLAACAVASADGLSNESSENAGNNSAQNADITYIQQLQNESLRLNDFPGCSGYNNGCVSNSDCCASQGLSCVDLRCR